MGLINEVIQNIVKMIYPLQIRLGHLNDINPTWSDDIWFIINLQTTSCLLLLTTQTI